MAKNAKNTKKVGNFQITFEKLNEEGRLYDVTSETIETNEFGYFMNSIQRLELVELYDEIVDDIRSEYLKANPKVKKVSDEAKLNIKSLARHMVFQILDSALYDTKHDWNLTADLLLNNYFFTEEKVVSAVSFAFEQCGNQIETEVFKPKMEWNKAYDKMLKWYAKPESNDFQVPQQVKYKLAKVKQHIDTYMWEEFLKQEYYTAKLMGLEDDGIIDLLHNPELITDFCDWCKGYAEGIEEAI